MSIVGDDSGEPGSDDDGGILSSIMPDDSEGTDSNSDGSVVSTSFIPSISDLPEDLPDDFQPGRGDGMIRSFINLVTAGVGTVVIAIFTGIASIPAGFYIAFENLAGGALTFLIEFLAVFFQPFQIGADCMLSSGIDCDPGQIPAIETTNAAVASAGLLGFALSIVVVGASAYALSTVVSKRVGG